MLLKLAWRNLWRNKRRTLITSASVFFAVLLSNFLVSIQDGMYDMMIENVVGLQMGYAQVHAKGYWDEQVIDNTLETSPGLEKKILDDPEVKGILPRLETFALAAAGDLSRGCAVIGIDADAEDAVTHLSRKVKEGRYFNEGPHPGALVASGLAEKLGLKVGDTLIMIGQGYHAASAAGKFAIAGLLKLGNPIMNNGMVYLTLPDAQRMYAAEGRISSYLLDMDSPEDAAIVAGEIESRLGPEYEVLDWQTMSPELMNMMEGDKGSNYIIVAILYLVVGFGIFGTVLMMTAERRHEFGVTVAIGMKRSKLALVMLLETLFVSMLGVVAGTVAVLPIVGYIHQNPIRLDSLAEAYETFGLEPLMGASVDPVIFINQALVVMVISMVVAIYPLQRILRLNAVKSMRA